MKKSLFSISFIMGMTLCLSFLTSCDKVFDCEDGDGSIVTETLTLDEFDSFKLKTSIDVVVQQGATQLVEVEGYSNLIDEIETNIDDKSWIIDMEERCYEDLEDMRIFITVPDLENIEILGSGDVEIKGDFDLDKLDIEVRGSGNVDSDASITAERISIEIAGSGDVELSGTTVEQEIEVIGSGKVRNFEMDSEECEVKIVASGDVEVAVSDKLTVKINGSGDVFYKGNPEVDISINGSGKVHNAN